MIAALAEGCSTVRNASTAGDPMSTQGCIEALGIPVRRSGEVVEVHGKGLHGLSAPAGLLDAGNSGTTMRLMTGILAGQRFNSVLTGDEFLNRRPMGRIIDPLTQMGAQITATDTRTAPLHIFAVEKLLPVCYQLPLPSAQVKSAVLLAGLYAGGTTEVIEPVTSRDHTERMLGLKVSTGPKGRSVVIQGGMKIPAREFVVPGDISAAAFWMVAACIVPDSEIRIINVGVNPTRRGVIDVLISMGAHIAIENEREVSGEPMGDLIVRTSSLRNTKLSGSIIPNIIDEIPVLAVAAAVSSGTFEVRDAHDLRNKECDRIAAVANNLLEMGVDVEVYDDGFAFEGVPALTGAHLDSYSDHRIAMAFAIAALVAQGETTIEKSYYASISFPTFWEVLEKIRKK
jgi:3-phosphoshikimate 1-carboxyvinyltransferase